MSEHKMTLQDWVRDPFVFNCNKHDLAPDCVAYADQQINAMTNAELVYALSIALEELNGNNKGT